MVFGILCLLAISFGMLQLLQLGSLTEKEVVQEAVEPTVEEKHETVIIPFPLKGRGVERAAGPRMGVG